MKYQKLSLGSVIQQTKRFTRGSFNVHRENIRAKITKSTKAYLEYFWSSEISITEVMENAWPKTEGSKQTNAPQTSPDFLETGHITQHITLDFTLGQKKVSSVTFIDAPQY